MITWMQKHRKYLVVTIWISVIAFVGAGFVGWGAYDFNSDRSGAVATVGDRKISIKEFQTAYSNLYNYYNEMMGGKLDQETADRLKLDELTLTNLINQALLLSYADEIGLIVLEEEIQQSIVDDENFQIGGKFNKDRYFQSLKNARIQPKDYEESLKNQILLRKISKILTIKPTDIELNMLAASTFMKDKLRVSVVDGSSVKVDVTQEDLIDYHKQNKNNFMTKKTYDLDIIEVYFDDMSVDDKELEAFFNETKHKYKDDEGKLQDFSSAKDKVIQAYKKKIAKKDALKKYLDFKKGNIQKQSTISITEASPIFDIEKFKNAKVNDFIKPIELDDRYIVSKLIKIDQPRPKSFDEAKKEVEVIVSEIKKQQELEKIAQSRLEMFTGEITEFVSRDDISKIKILSPEESAEFLNEVFSSKEQKGYKIINNKAVLYEIMEQQLLDTSKLDSYGDLLSENLAKLKDAELNQNLVKLLKDRYEIQRYYKGR